MIYGFVRAGKNSASVKNQRESVSVFAQKQGFSIGKWIEAKGKDSDKKLEKLIKGDTIIVAKLFRFGLDITSITQALKRLLENGIIIISAEDNLTIGDETARSVMAYCFGLVSEIAKENRAQISKESLDLIRQSGRKLGRPSGSANRKLKLEVHLDEIKNMRENGYSSAHISRALDIAPSTLRRFLKRFPAVKKEKAGE